MNIRNCATGCSASSRRGPGPPLGGGSPEARRGRPGAPRGDRRRHAAKTAKKHRNPLRQLAKQIRGHGGLAGVRDEGTLESALARPRHKWHYQETSDLAALAAAYRFGLCRNHPYRDGSKRVAFVVMVVSLELNGLRFKAQETEVVMAMLALAAGEVPEKELAAWLRAHCNKPKGRGR